MNQHQAVADHRTGKRFASHFGLPGDRAVGAVQRINLRALAADIDMLARRGYAAGKQGWRIFREKAVIGGKVNFPFFFTVAGVQRLHDAETIGRIDGVILPGGMQIGVEVANAVADGGAPHFLRFKLVFHFRQRGHFDDIFFAAEQRATAEQSD